MIYNALPCVTPCDTLWHHSSPCSRCGPRPQREGHVEKAQNRDGRISYAAVETSHLGDPVIENQAWCFSKLPETSGFGPNVRNKHASLCKEKGFIYTNTLVFYTKPILKPYFFPWQATFFMGLMACEVKTKNRVCVRTSAFPLHPLFFRLWAMKVYKIYLVIISYLPTSIMLSHLISCYISKFCQQIITIRWSIRGCQCHHPHLCQCVTEACNWQTKTESEAEIMSCIKKYSENALGNSPQTSNTAHHPHCNPPCSKRSK